jgi:zinc transporter 2
MFVIALFGILVNVVLYFVLGGEHGHGHSHDHGHAAFEEEEEEEGEGETTNGHEHGHEHSYQQEARKQTRSGYVELARHDHDHDHDHDRDHDHGHDHEQSEHSALMRSPSDRILDLTLPSYGTIEEGLSSFSIAPTVEHDHGHRHEDVNLKAAVLHVITDFVQAVGVAVAGAVIWFKPDWQIVDPLCTFLFSFMVVWSTVNMLRSVVSILLEGVPPHIDYQGVKDRLAAISGVNDVHDLHIWSISSGKIVLTAHLRADNPAAILPVANRVCNEMGIHHCTFQVQEDNDQLCHSVSCSKGGCA